MFIKINNTIFNHHYISNIYTCYFNSAYQIVIVDLSGRQHIIFYWDDNTKRNEDFNKVCNLLQEIREENPFADYNYVNPNI